MIRVSHVRPMALASTALALILTAYSVLKPPRDSTTGQELAIELVIVLAVCALTFALTRRSIASSRRDRPSEWAAFTVSVLGFLSIAVFWLGIFSVALAGAAVVLALHATGDGGRSALTKATIGIAAVTVPVSVLIAIVS
jgi:hypothetical protein